MISQTSEYAPGRTEAAGASNNGHNKVFKLAPVEDVRTKIILEARRQALRDGDLDFGARCLFTLLLDLSLSWWTQRADGVVCVSVTKLSEELKCSPRTIYDWKRQLEERRYVWVTEQRMPNMWPVNTYHLSALDSPDEPRQLPTRDGLWGNGARRDRPLPGEGARGTPLHSLHARKAAASLESSNLGLNSGATGSAPQVSAAKFAAGSGKVCTGEPQSLRRGAAEFAPGSGKKGRVAAAKKDMRQPQNPSDNKESIDPDNRPG
jgi:hypothetical protein